MIRYCLSHELYEKFDKVVYTYRSHADSYTFNNQDNSEGMLLF